MTHHKKMQHSAYSFTPSYPTLIETQSPQSVPPSQRFSELIKFLSCETTWQNIYIFQEASYQVELMCSGLADYVIAKGKSEEVKRAIFTNGEMTMAIKSALIDRLLEIKFIVNENEAEKIFTMCSQKEICHDVKDYLDTLSSFIFKKQVAPNFQTDVGNIFHILARAVDDNKLESATDTLQKLLDIGCDIFAVNKFGWTPFELAVARGSEGRFAAKLFADLACGKFKHQQVMTHAGIKLHRLSIADVQPPLQLIAGIQSLGFSATDSKKTTTPPHSNHDVQLTGTTLYYKGKQYCPVSQRALGELVGIIIGSFGVWAMMTLAKK